MLEMLTGLVSAFILIPRSIVHSPETKGAHFKGPGAEQICWLTFLPAGLSPAPMAACLAALAALMGIASILRSYPFLLKSFKSALYKFCKKNVI